jgi:ribulose-5-phosphate 4-epimerase/fuculose-1-phosphate aldolase
MSTLDPPPGMDPAEWQARMDLAACYRLFDWLGWAEGLYNHITLRLPGRDPAELLINPYGLHYGEVTARNLVRIDLAGRVLDGSPHPVNAAGLVIHSAVHAARADAHCVMHTHTTAVMGVACKASGLRADNFYSAQFHGRVGRHAFEGITTRPDEGRRLVASLGPHPVLLLENHGVLVAGDTLPAAFAQLWMFQRACEVQLAADTLAGPSTPVAPAVLDALPGHIAPMRPGGARPGEMLFRGLLRRAGLTPAAVA